jgi:hypothetical protein
VVLCALGNCISKMQFPVFLEIILVMLHFFFNFAHYNRRR